MYFQILQMEYLRELLIDKIDEFLFDILDLCTANTKIIGKMSRLTAHNNIYELLKPVSRVP